MNSFFDQLTKDQRAATLARAPVELRDVGLPDWPGDSIGSVLCAVLGVPTHPIAAENVDLGAYRKYQQHCSRLQFLPLFEEGTILQIASVQPWNESLLYDLRKISEQEVRLLGVSEANFEQTLATIEGRLAMLTAVAPVAPPALLEPPLTSWKFDYKDTQNAFQRLASVVIDAAHRRGAADLHLEPMEDRLRIRFRLDEELTLMPPLPISMGLKLVEAFKIKANIPADETATEQRGRIRERTSIGPLDLRVQVTPTLWGQTVVCRLLDPRTLSAMGGNLPFEGKMLEQVQAHVDSYSRIHLVVGPTGSGKSTTILRIIMSLDRGSVSIRTIEEPVEYALDGINQTDVSNGRISYQEALKADLRNDPDVLVVGEIRDLETAKIAIQAAQTGHMLFSTLHTDNTTETVARLVTLGVDPAEIASALGCVIAQRLLPKLCSCKVEIPTPEKVKRYFKAYGLTDIPAKIYTKRGCPACRGLGTKGRKPIFEVLSMVDDLKVLVEKPFDAERFRAKWRALGGETLGMYALGLVAKGVVDPSELDAACAEVLHQVLAGA